MTANLKYLENPRKDRGRVQLVNISTVFTRGEVRVKSWEEVKFVGSRLVLTKCANCLNNQLIQ